MRAEDYLPDNYESRSQFINCLQDVQRQDLLETDFSFGPLDDYRNSLNQVQKMGDFIEDTAEELLTHAASLVTLANEIFFVEVVDKEEKKQLVKLV